MWKSPHNMLGRWRGRLKPHIVGVVQSTSGLAFNIIGIIAGSILAESYNVFTRHSWALLIFPALLSIRGAIGGLFSGRLSTGLHLGTIKPSIRGNTDEAVQLFSAIITLTGLSAVFIGVGGGVFAAVSYHLSVREVIKLLITVFSTLALSILTISPTTFLVSIKAFNRGLDPDMVVYPITSTTADIVISFIYVSILWLLEQSSWFFNSLILLIVIVFAIGIFWLHSKNRGKKAYSNTVFEFIGTLLVVTVIVTFTGSVLGRISAKIGDTAEVYAIYPAMIDTVGDVGSMIGSTATTKLGLGYFSAELKSVQSHLSEIFYAWSGSLILFTLYAFISSGAYGLENILPLLKVVWGTNLMVVPLIALVSFSVGIITFKRGLDPDNFVIPFETSLADSITTMALYLMLILFY